MPPPTSEFMYFVDFLFDIRGLFMARLPALKTAIYFALGILLARFFSLPFYVLLIIISIGIFLSILLYVFSSKQKSYDKILDFLLIFLLIGIGAFRYIAITKIVPPNNLSKFCKLPRSVKIIGTVSDEPRKTEFRTLLTVNSEFIHTGARQLPTSGKFLASVKPKIDILDFCIKS